MEYKKIVAVTGLPGLYELVSSKNDGALVRSLENSGTRFVSSRVHNFSHLESIEVFTTSENVNLGLVFEAMQKSTEPLPDEKDPALVRKYFEKVFPDIDQARVYNSDMKKMIRWFAILQANGIEITLPETEPEPSPAEEPLQEEPVAEAPVKKKTAKKKADDKEQEASEQAAKPEAKPKTRKKAG